MYKHPQKLQNFELFLKVLGEPGRQPSLPVLPLAANHVDHDDSLAATFDHGVGVDMACDLSDTVEDLESLAVDMTNTWMNSSIEFRSPYLSSQRQSKTTCADARYDTRPTGAASCGATHLGAQGHYSDTQRLDLNGPSSS